MFALKHYHKTSCFYSVLIVTLAELQSDVEQDEENPLTHPFIVVIYNCFPKRTLLS